MGFLLLQYEYQRATRKYNSCVATGMRLNNRIERCTKRISKIESIYDKAETKLNSKYNKYTSILAQYVSSATAQLSAAQTGNDASLAVRNMFSGIGTLGGVKNTVNITVDTTAGWTDSTNRTKIVADIVSQISQMQLLIKNQLEALQEQEQAELDEQEEEQLEPINTLNTELESQQACNDTLTTMWEERKNNAKDRLGDNIQSSVAHYGLS